MTDNCLKEMFKDRSNLRTPECPTFEFEDNDGDVCCLQFYSDSEGGCNLVELSIYSETSCLVLNKEQAIKLAEKIIEEVNKGR